MKILMIAPYPELGKPIDGGVEAVAYSLIDGFKDYEGFEMIVLSSGHERSWTTKINANITIKYLSKQYTNRKIDLIKNVKPTIISLNESWNPDIIHIQGNGTMYLLFDKSFQKKLIMTPHAVIAEEIKNTRPFYLNINRIIALLIELYTKRHVHNMVFISDFIRSRLLHKKKTNGLYEKIYDPVSLKYYYPSNKTDINNKEVHLFFIGSIIPLKGLDYLLIALSKSNLRERIILHVAGNFSIKKYETYIKELIESLGLKKNVIFHGRMKSEDIINFANYDALVLPSHCETFGCVVAEAMSMGKFVLATRVGAIPELIEDGITGLLFEDKNSDAIADSLTNLLNMSPEVRDEMGKRAKEKATKLFYPTIIARQHLDFYQKFLSIHKNI